MITDNQAKEAIKTIAEYCQQFRGYECIDGTCVLSDLCGLITPEVDPESWPEYLEEENE